MELNLVDYKTLVEIFPKDIVNIIYYYVYYNNNDIIKNVQNKTYDLYQLLNKLNMHDTCNNIFDQYDEYVKKNNCQNLLYLDDYNFKTFKYYDSFTEYDDKPDYKLESFQDINSSNDVVKWAYGIYKNKLNLATNRTHIQNCYCYVLTHKRHYGAVFTYHIQRLFMFKKIKIAEGVLKTISQFGYNYYCFNDMDDNSYEYESTNIVNYKKEKENQECIEKTGLNIYGCCPVCRYDETGECVCNMYAPYYSD